nr:serine/threonine-protein kinase [Nonomuraea sp. FMUSA5-5]
MLPGDPPRVEGYWLAGRLGAGGQGVGYEAYDDAGTRVAVKVLHPEARDRFAKEAEAARRVASFCTTKVLAVDLDGDKPYIVSEFVPGRSLRRVVQGGRRFAGDDLYRLATAVATALTAVHDAGVIHGDLKPDNVLLGPDGPRVIDFGIARTDDMSLTRSGEVKGTPSYMAPEVFTGQRAGAAADVFAWGAVVVFAATGEDPFHADNLGGVMHRVLSAQPDLSALPSRLAGLVAAALAGLLVIAVAAGGVAFVQGRRAAEQGRTVARQRDQAVGRQVAAQADRLRTTDPVTAMLLSVAGWRLAPGPDTRRSLMGSLTMPERAAFHDPAVKGVSASASAAAGRIRVVASGDGVRVFDVPGRRQRASWTWPRGFAALPGGAALSPSGATLVMLDGLTMSA